MRMIMKGGFWMDGLMEGGLRGGFWARRSMLLGLEGKISAQLKNFWTSPSLS